MRKKPILPVLFTVIMLVCVLFVIWYIPSVSTRRFQLEDVQKSLETSRGRERKQQAEYEETVAALPEAEAELESLKPQMEAAQEEVKNLKAERKKLREEKKELEESAPDQAGEESNHE